ncbi:hypothetical protein [uncultured Senegalimassilia sp.]|uniref:hypothetical protein n=1 Tax=uncultured Senegalimassilia sp. TaxID=1714350 RepID=UPI0026002175|nr:hypothetical protein [uncultured Senegalimassilia sp.]
MGSQGNNGQARLRDAFSARKRMVAAAAWLAVLALVLSAATFAWFSNSRFTNVTPAAHTVSEDGYDLLISASEQGPFAEQCQLASADKTLYPVSTSDLSDFWRATFQNAAGITTDYANCTSELGEYALTGTFYLKGSSLPLAVYLYPSQMSVSADSQLLAAARVGFIIQSSAGTQSYIFRYDDLGDTSGAAQQRTTAQSDVVVSGQGSWSYVADPAQSVSAYSMDGSGDTPTARSGATPLFTLGADEVASVRYFVYMEGCDANCIGEAQSQAISLQFAFAGAKA